MGNEERLAEILGEWYEGRDRGEAIDPEDVIAVNPDLAEDLRERFAALDFLHLALASSIPPGPARPEAVGPYRILGELGSGGMGRVYLAETESRAAGLASGSRVALKLVHPHLLERPGFFKRFLREAEVGQTVQHPNVVRTLDCDAVVQDAKHHHFLVMEYVEGQTLSELLRELERVPEELCRHIGHEVARGLQAIHEAGVVHRDLKPENVLITADHVVKVMDLGVARLQDEAIRLSQTGAFVGSLEYASPEQIRGGGANVDGRTDLHALGLLLYELATGQHPFREEDTAAVFRKILEEEPRKAGALHPQLSPFLEELVHTLLKKSPDERLPSAAVLAEVLEEGEASSWWQDRARTLRLETKRPMRRIRIPRETALYGREADLATLEKQYETAKSGEGRVLLLEGEAGIGKTRLVDEYVRQLQQSGEDVNFLYGSYPPGGAATAAGAFSTAYREHFGSEGLEEVLESYISATPVLIPSFAAVLRGEMTPDGAELLTKDSLQTVFVHATTALAAERPTIVLIDDLHFAPEDGRALFASLALATPRHRVLLIGTMRPGVPADWTANLTRLDQTTLAPLPRLGPKDLAKLLEDAFHSKRLADELGMQIARKSDGNPFFAFEIIRGLRDGQFIKRKPDGTWVTTQVIRDIQVPSSVMDLVQARVAGLTEEERDLLDVASCAGFAFDPLVIGIAVGLERVPTLKRFGQIERRHHLVRAAGRTFVFDHHQMQESLYAGLSEPLREEYHAAIAEALEASSGAAGGDPKEVQGQVAVQICEHYLQGAQGERALPYFMAALAHLESGYLNGQAIALIDRALAVGDLLCGRERIELLHRKIGRLSLLGRHEEQGEVAAEIMALSDAVDDAALRSRAHRAMGNYHMRLSRHAQARREFELARKTSVAGHDRRGEAAATGSLGRVLGVLGRPVEARQYFEMALRMCCEVHDRGGEAVSLDHLGSLLGRHGSYREAREHFARALSICREIGQRKGEANATGGLGGLLWRLGCYEEALAHHERWLAVSREIGDRAGERAAAASLGLDYIHLGRYVEAREHLERALAIAVEVGDLSDEARASGNLGIVAHHAGRHAEALQHYTHHLTRAREFGNRYFEAVALVNLGPCLALLGQPTLGRKRLLESLAICREVGAKRVQGYALEGLGKVAHQLGEHDEAERRCRQTLTLRKELGSDIGVPYTLLLVAQLLASSGRTAQARECVDEALTLCQELDDPANHVLAACQRALHHGGDLEAALAKFHELKDRMGLPNTMEAHFLLWRVSQESAHLREASRLLDHLVEHAPEDCRESMIARVPLHRDIAAAWAARDAE